MKNLVSLAFVLAAASQLTACIIVDDSGDDDVIDSTRLDVSWTLKSGNQIASCRPDTAAATLWACPGDCPNVAAASGDIFTCSNGQGSIPAGGDPALALAPGRYTIWMEFSTTNKQVYAKSFSQTVTLGRGGLSDAHFDVQVDHGFFDLQWVFAKGSQMLTCGQIANHGRVETIAGACGDPACKDPGNAEPVSSEFVCEDGAGRTNPIKFNGPNGYSISVGLLDSANDHNIGAVADGMRPITGPFTIGNEAKNLGSVLIQLP
jgi:hypothetical protein